MKLRHIALGSILASQTAFGGALFGMSPYIGGFNLVKINTTSGLAQVVANYPMTGVAAFNSMTYDAMNKRLLAVANVSPTSSYLVAIDPMDYSMTSVPVWSGAPFFEGIEYLNWTNQIALAVGSGPNYTNQLWIHDTNMFLNSGWVWGPTMDMDTLFTDGQFRVCHLDVNNSFDTSPRHIINNALATTGSATMTPVGDWSIYNESEYDVAYHPVQDRLYVTRGSALAYYNSAGTTLTNIGNYGGPLVTCLAYGAEPHLIYGTLILDDMLSNFAPGISRTINWAVKQGTITAASGSVTTNTAIVNFAVSLPDSIQGYSIWEWDTGSSLKEKLIIIMPGNSFGFGTVHLLNGDADHSGEVDAADIDNVISNFGNSYPGPGNVDADVNGTGEVDADDIDIVIACFGNTDD
ncbi:MAG: hypothetical protein JNK63_00485 [Chthonomonas sp.]|nr:hypothetical protein [Chthonomonas sp.]